MTNPKLPIRKILFIGILFLAAFGERVLFDLGPNVELITMAMILASFYFGKKESFWLTFAIIAVSDRIIGNSNIFLFTWTGFLIPAILLPKLFGNWKASATSSLKIGNYLRKIISLTGTGLLANLFFYTHTNLGVWLLSNMYPKTAAGLVMSYVNALPFFRYQLTGTLIFVPLGFTLTEIAIYLLKNYQVRVRVQGTPV